MKIVQIIIATLMITINALASEYDCHEPCKTKSNADTTINGIKLFYSKLEDAFKKFGKAEIYSPDDNNFDYICYVSDNDDDQTAIVFGAYTNIDTAEIYKFKSQVPPTIQCTKSSKVHKNIKFDSGLKLGSSVKQLNKMHSTIKYSNNDEINVFECCVVKTKKCNGLIRTHLSTKNTGGEINYIKIIHTEYCE